MKLLNDPIFYGQLNLSPSEKAKLYSGDKVVNELNNLVFENKTIDDVILNSKDVMQHFHKIFPEVVKSNDTGNLNKDSFALWENNNNNISIELDSSTNRTIQPKYDVYIGGPASAVAAALQAKSGESTSKILYGHDGRRGVSNWKGSASYFHIRDSVPVYYWPDNHGAYTLYATAKHFVQRNFFVKNYMNNIASDPNWNKLRLNVKNFIKDPSTTWLFAKNQYYAMQDVGLHIKGTELRDKSKQTAKATTVLASLTPEIFNHLETKKPLLLQSDKNLADAIYTFLGPEKDVEETEAVINNLKSIAGDDLLDHHFLSTEEISKRGYDANHVKKAAIFPKDGNFPPYLDEEFETLIEEKGGKVLDNMQLKTILVKPNVDKEDVEVSKIIWENTKTGEIQSTAINSLYLSLGPSMKSLKVNIPPEYLSLGARLKNIFGINQNLIGQIMWASASSIVFMVRVDCSKIDDEGLRCLRDHIDGHNKHIIRLAEKDVFFGDKKYKYFVMQSTGGGHFPSKHAHAETALNVFQANIIPILGLDRDGIEYDILQVRSCARGVTAQNAFRMSAPASNMVMIYGLGGIGMSTMAGNGLLMKALMGLRQNVANNTITSSEYKNSLTHATFGNAILHWNKANPFTQNYAQFIDNVNNPKFLMKQMRILPKEGSTALGIASKVLSKLRYLK